MAEQDNNSGMDDWAEAMAEQSTSEQEPSKVVEETLESQQAVAGGEASGFDSSLNLDVLMDVPVSISMEIGRANLTGNGNNLSVAMNDVTFFSYSTGAAPRIWAT